MRFRFVLGPVAATSAGAVEAGARHGSGSPLRAILPHGGRAGLQLGEGTLSFRDQFVALPHLGFHHQAAAPGMEDAGDAAHLAVGDGADVVDLAFQG
ncbi:Uncharacterised protein [Pseudomonas aeruginosa]|nr:Uncharacterised protein [Pseudomonas aeruginosa]